MKSCVFCKIIEKKIAAKVEYENEEIIVFHDIAPKAEIHLLLVPKKHLRSVNEIKKNDELLMGKLFFLAKKIARQKRVENGYRLVVNVGRDSGQIVEHLHIHFLADKSLKNLKER